MEVADVSLYFITFAGFPATIAFAGTSLTTTLPAAIMALSPIVMFPMQVTFTPKSTLLPMVGFSLCLSLLLTPNVVRCLIMHPFPMLLAAICDAHACSK